MKRQLLISALAMALAMPMLAAPATASASCAGRKLTGTVIGGIGGALIGNSIARGGGGALIGGVGGAVVGHEIGRSTCGHARRTAYYDRRDPRAGGERTSARNVYYDERGQPVAQNSAYSSLAASSAGPGSCHTEMRSYYDDRGALIQSPAQVCAR